MSSPRLCLIFFPALSLCAATAFAAAAFGATTTAPADVERSKESEAIQLAPFEVVTANDDGWVAGSSMLGNRINQPLRETPISIDALTRDFLMDVGAFTPEEAGRWVANVTVQPDHVTRSDLGNFNFRGLTNQFSANRNFFRWYGPQDNYNVERLDFGLGSNTLIFGDNDPGGQATTYTKRALPGRTFSRVLVQGGSFDSHRVEFDHNQSLNQRLALRVNLVNRDDRRNFDWQRFAYRGYHVGLTLQPLKRTVLRLEGETSGNYRTWGDNNLMIRERAVAGLGFTNRLTVLPNGRLVDNSVAAATPGTPNNTDLGDGTIYLTARDRTNPTGGTGTALSFLDRNIVQPLGSAVAFHGLPEHYMFAGTAARNNRTYSTWTATLEHRFSDALGVDLAFNQQNQWFNNVQLGSVNTATADIAGRLFLDTNYQNPKQRNHMGQYRASVNYRFTRWKWMQQFIVLRGEYRDDRNVNHTSQFRTFGPNYGATGLQPFYRVFFTDPYPAAALTEERLFRTMPPGTRLFGTTAAGQNHLARAFSLSTSGRYFGGRILTLLGTRYDDNFTYTYNATLNGVTRDAVTGEVFSWGDRKHYPQLWQPYRLFDQERWSGNAGLVYVFNPRINVYYTYSTSYRFGGNNNFLQQPTGPLLGTTHEIGVKSAFLGDRLIANFAAYDIVRDNVVINITRTGITDAQLDAFVNYGLTPASPDYRPVLAGATSPDVSSQRSRGLEATLTYNPATGLSLRFSGAYKKVTLAEAFPVLKETIAAVEERGPINDPDVRGTLQRLRDTAYVQGALGRQVTGAFPAVTAPISFSTAANYRFARESVLRGASVGVNGTYSGPAVLRYTASYPDNSHLSGGQSWSVGANAAYRTKIFARTTTFLLHLSNLYAPKYQLFASTARLDGSNAFRYVYGEPLTFRASATVEF